MCIHLYIYCIHLFIHKYISKIAATHTYTHTHTHTHTHTLQVPGGYDRMALRVTVAVPAGYASSVDTVQVKKVFPYGQCNLEIVEGGGAFSSGIALPALQVSFALY